MSDEAAGEPAEETPPRFPAPAGPGQAPPKAQNPGPPPAAAEPTGDPRVDEVVARLRELDGAPVSAHVEVFEEIHQRLQELLAAADEEEPRPPVPGAWQAGVAGPGSAGRGGPPGHGQRP